MASRPRFIVILSCLVAGLGACEGGRGPQPEPTAAAPADTTRALRQRIVFLESIRSFGNGELQRALAHTDPRVRRAAAMAFGRIQDGHAAQILLPLLQDADSTVVEQAAWALRQLQGLDESTRHAVQAALTRQIELEVKPKLWIPLEALRPHAGPASVKVVGPWIAAGLLAGMGSQARPPLVEGMAALALASVGNEQAVKTLSHVGDLTNREAAAAWRLAEAMTILPDSAFFRSVLSLAEHAHPYARAAGARALGKHGRAEALPALFRLLADFDWEVRASALRALGEIGDPQSLSYCASMVSDSHPLVREAALAAMEKLGPASRVHLVEDALHDPVPAVRLAVVRVLAKALGAEARDASEAARRDSVEFGRAAALAVAAWVFGEEAATPLLLRSLEDAAARERAQAARALGELHEPLRGERRRAVQRQLAAALEDGDFVVATLAAEALGKLGLSGSATALMQAFEQRRRTHNDVDVRLTIVPAIASLAPHTSASERPALVEFLERARDDADERVAYEARKGLAKLRSQPEPALPLPRARPALPFPESLPPVDLGLVQVRLVTRHGEAILELDGNRFPRTVASFLQLVDRGFYDDGVFHRVVPAFVVQGGCPRGDGWGDAGQFLPCEYGNLRYDTEGIVGMAHAGKDTGGSQFFITHLPVPRLDGRYTAFGRVVQGMNVVDRIVRGDRFRIERMPPSPQP
ncbi:MAG: HEAT repeat domain-containing protein [Candidatus Krumholzibacteriia bacterium]